MSIKVLSNEIINQIAAGEVIENPAGVIKELVENSLDAKATHITVNIEDSGLKKISVKDNGVGMSKDDLINAPKRHATSKIQRFEDLYSISSMGFRGEALASIFSISKATIVSREKNKDAGYKITNQEESFEPQETGHSGGTTVIVEELFYNTPARKKYLKSKTVELKNALESLKRVAIAHPEVAFELNHNSYQLFEKPSLNSTEKSIVYSLGKDIKGKLLSVEHSTQGIYISGYITDSTQISYSYKKNQYVYVNNRFVKSKLINDAVYEGYGSNLMVGRHPGFVLFIQIDPEIIDVNVHPTKIQIRFENEAEIFREVKNAVKSTFESVSLFKPFEEESESQTKLVDEEEVPNKISKEDKKDYFVPDYQKHFEIKEESVLPPKPDSKEDSFNQEEDKGYFQVKGPLYETLLDYRIIGQLNKTYIIIETKEGMIIVDQHVAEEKFNYEKLIYDRENNKVKKQALLKPYIISLNNTDMLEYNENKDLLNELGFDSEIFGKQEIAVRSVPVTIGNKTNHPERLKSVLHSILADKSSKVISEEYHSKIASIACRSSVMAGDELSYPQMKKIIENLKYLRQPFQCPHGRPTFLKYKFKDLEKKFKRVV